MQASVPPPANAHASSSTGHLGAPYHPTLQRVEPLPSFQRVDINAIKQELHDVLGDRGLPYWKALNGYLLGQICRDEMISMVTRWLKGPQVDLHNRLLQALLYNASAPTLTTQSPALSNLRKRRRLGTDDPEFDTDDTRIEPKARVHSWVMGLTGKERMRVRRAVIGRGQDEDGEEGDEGDGKKKKSISFAPTTCMPPIALSDGALPSSHQLSLRLSQLAKAYDLTLAPESTSEIGEFMAVGMDSHVADVMTTLVRLIGQDRRGVDTIHIPTGLVNNEKEEFDEKSPVRQVKEEHDLPKPDLDTMQYLFNLVPELHTQASPAVYKLLTSQAKPVIEVQHIKSEPQVHSPLATTSVTATARPGGSAAHVSPVKSTLGLPVVSKVEATKERLIKSELLKLDSGKGDGEGKKDRKHLNHWKYEDPAVAFQDLLG